MNTDSQRPSTWVRFRPSLCEGCMAGCCTLPVEVSPQDLVRLELISEDEAQGSLKKVARRLEKEGWIQNFRAKSGLSILRQKDGDDCIFLNEKRQCTVYEKRPDVCRKFPTELSPRIGYCPAKKIPK